MTERFSVNKVKEMLGEIVDSCFKRAQELQKAEGYAATVVAGRVTFRDGEPTGALPGKLVRGQQPRPGG